MQRVTMPETQEAKRICKEDLNEVITAFVQDKTAIENGLFNDNTLPEEEVHVTPMLVANHTGTLLRATLDGAGISTQPSDLISRPLCEGKLVQLLPEWTTGVFTLYATMPSRQFMPARVRALLDFLAENTNRNISKLLPFGVPPVALKT